MSATYRIEISLTNDSAFHPWEAKIVRLSDEWPVRIETHSTYDLAEYAARKWIEADSNAPTDLPKVLHVDDQGRDAEAPQSVKVP